MGTEEEAEEEIRQIPFGNPIALSESAEEASNQIYDSEEQRESEDYDDEEGNSDDLNSDQQFISMDESEEPKKRRIWMKHPKINKLN